MVPAENASLSQQLSRALSIVHRLEKKVDRMSELMQDRTSDSNGIQLMQENMQLQDANITQLKEENKRLQRQLVASMVNGSVPLQLSPAFKESCRCSLVSSKRYAIIHYKEAENYFINSYRYALSGTGSSGQRRRSSTRWRGNLWHMASHLSSLDLQ
jgi:hypothetical protein